MNTVTVVVAVVAVAIGMVSAQHRPPGNGLAHLVDHEVHTLLQANKDLTVAECTQKCDALFDLVESHDEQAVDDMCAHSCKCMIDHVCGHNNHHVTQPDPTNQHPTQPTRSPPFNP